MLEVRPNTLPEKVIKNPNIGLILLAVIAFLLQKLIYFRETQETTSWKIRKKSKRNGCTHFLTFNKSLNHIVSIPSREFTSLMLHFSKLFRHCTPSKISGTTGAWKQPIHVSQYSQAQRCQRTPHTLPCAKPWIEPKYTHFWLLSKYPEGPSPLCW